MPSVGRQQLVLPPNAIELQFSIAIFVDLRAKVARGVFMPIKWRTLAADAAWSPERLLKDIVVASRHPKATVPLRNDTP